MTEHTGHPDGAVGRLLHELTVGTIQAVRTKDKRKDAGAREMEQQFQVAISGEAGSVPAWHEVTVEFDYAFFFAPGQRHSSLEYPHFTYGSQTNPAVGIHATVKEWLHDETNGSIIGAVVNIGAVGEGAFTGVAHLTFQGYGSFIEEDEVPLVNEG